jgi:succinyl-CoA synthetase alpha subunit
VSAVLNEVRHATYLDSIVLMRMSREIAALPGVEEAGLMLGTPANKEILRDAGILDATGEGAGAGDLILALRATDEAAGRAALAAARRLLDQPPATGAAEMPEAVRTVRAALQEMPDANLALISVPGHFAASEARKALGLGLHVMIFSDNVSIEDEIALKHQARERGLLLMGPDCGTAILGGVPLGFANVVPRDEIGLIGASGTGIQEVSCLIARMGGGISHAIGTGGRDLAAEVGAVTTLMALDVLDADPQTRHIVLISKPPSEAVARTVLDRVSRSAKRFTICFLGARELDVPANARLARTLKDAAEIAVGHPMPASKRVWSLPALRGNRARGLFAGGTLCAEAQVMFRQAGLKVASNVPVPGASAVTDDPSAHVMIDLGDDAFTRGRPHPMIDPLVRDAPLAHALADPAVGVVLLDVVLGYGSHSDPAGHLAGFLGARDRGPLIIASVTGTDADPQSRVAQVGKLADAGVIVAPSNADAAALTITALGGAAPGERAHGPPQ